MGTLAQKIRNIFWGEVQENGERAAPAMRVQGAGQPARVYEIRLYAE